MDARVKAEENRILEVRVGSHLFGTDTPESDLDLFGVFMPWDENLFGFQRCLDGYGVVDALDDESEKDGKR